MSATDIRRIRSFEELCTYLEEELDWRLDGYEFEDLTFDFEPEELGLKDADAAKVRKIRQLRPLKDGQPWGIFFIEFEKKRLPVVVLRRILSSLVIKKRQSANQSDRAAFKSEDLLFITRFGTSDEPEIAFAHFHNEQGDLPTLRVLGWDGSDTPLKLDNVARTLQEKLRWPLDTEDHTAWRNQWSGAFRHRLGHVIRTADLLAEELAHLARGIRDAARILLTHESAMGPLTKLFKAFKAALIHDLTEEAFVDTYAQTITYGLLTAAISRTEMSEGRLGTALIATNVTDMVPITNPFLKEMLQEFLKVGGRKGGINFDELGIQDVVELLRGDETDLPEILRNFGDRKPGEDPVIHFYEHFLSAYNKKLKIQRGVFYTPQPVVSYIVRSVHELLQTEFGVEDGLASTVTWGEMVKTHAGMNIPEGAGPDQPFVQILDPATGTATFLVEVIDVVNRHLEAKWKTGGLTVMPRLPSSNWKLKPESFQMWWNQYVALSLLPRLHGYELMMAPYAIAHMKIGLKLHETGYRFGTDERARIYLTNALEPATDEKKQQEFAELAPALAHEAQAVNAIKRGQRFTVVIGNPPYSNFGQLNRIPFILDLLKDYKRGLDEKKLNLDDDFIKFIRLAHWLIQSSQCGLVGLITNHVFLGGTTHRRLRESLCATFHLKCYVDLHGNSRTGEVCPDGSADENVFDIQQGVAISLLASPPQKIPTYRTLYADTWGLREKKYEWAFKHSFLTTLWSPLAPTPPDFLFCPSVRITGSDYSSALSIPEMLTVACSGIETQRDNFVMHFQPDDAWDLVARLATMSAEAARREFDLGPDGRDWQLTSAISDVRKSGPTREAIVPIAYRPFDVRWTYYTGNTKGFLAYPRKEASRHMLAGDNIALAMKRSRLLQADQFSHVFAIRHAMDKNFLGDQSYFLPLYTKNDVADLFSRTGRGAAKELVPNLSSQALAKVPKDLVGTAGRDPQTFATEIFGYLYAVLHSPIYRSLFLDYLKRDFARVPITKDPHFFRALARLGGELVALHLLESPKLDSFITTYSGPKNPEIGRVGWSNDTVWLDAVGTKKDQAAMPGTICFRGVPEAVWNFQIGGYHVCDKWLKDRKGRKLLKADLVHYQKIVVALAETIRLMKQIDEVIGQHGGWPNAFASPAGPAAG